MRKTTWKDYYKGNVVRSRRKHMTNLKWLMIHNRFSRRKARSLMTLYQRLRKLDRNRKLPRPGAMPLD